MDLPVTDAETLSVLSATKFPELSLMASSG
jgi:hypothetical protein